MRTSYLAKLVLEDCQDIVFDPSLDSWKFPCGLLVLDAIQDRAFVGEMLLERVHKEHHKHSSDSKPWRIITSGQIRGKSFKATFSCDCG